MALLDQIISAESGGNPTLTNPRSSAGGLGQFLNSTWLSTIKRDFPQIADGKTDAQIIALKTDPAQADLQRQALAAFTKGNQDYLTSKGIDPTPGNTYLAHFAGPGGAVAALSNPDAPVEKILGQAAVDANPQIRGMTGAQLAQWADNTVNKQSGGRMAADLSQPQQTGLLGLLGIQNQFGAAPQSSWAPQTADTFGNQTAASQPLSMSTPLGDFSIGQTPGQNGQPSPGVTIGTPLGSVNVSGGAQSNPALAALADPPQQQQQPFSMAPQSQPQKAPVNLAALAQLAQIPKLGLLA
jgi:hypothetical protein